MEKEYYEEYEIDLREYIMLLWDHKWLIISLFIIAIISAFFASQYILTPVYEVESVIYAPDFSLLNGDNFKQNDYLSYLYKNETKEKIIRKFNLNKNSEEDFSINLEKIITVNSEEESNLVTIKLKGNDPKKSFQKLNYLIDLFRNNVIDFVKEENQRYIDNLQNNMENYNQEYLQLKNELEKFKSVNNISLMKNRINSLESMVVGYERDITQKERLLIKNQEKYNIVNKQLKNTDKFVTTEEVISESVLRKMKFILQENINLEELNNITTTQQSLNPEYINLINRKNNLEQSLEELKTDLKVLRKDRENINKKIEGLQLEIAKKENKLDKLKQNLNITEKNYNSAERQYSNTKQKFNSREYKISIINSAALPQTAVSPNVKLNVAIAGVLALMLGVFIVFFREFLKEDEEENYKA